MPLHEMHQLPFNAQLTEKLFELVKQSDEQESYGARGYSPSFIWAQQGDVPGIGKFSWFLAWIPKHDIEPERVFIVDGVSFYIPSDIEFVLTGRVLDWDDEKGVVSHAA